MWTRQLDKAHVEVEKLTGVAPKKYKDFRDLLKEQKPDIAIVATPDHWHPLITIAACEAGAHVYVEKPIGHTVLEGRAMVAAARAADRVVQVGTHRRVSPHNMWAIQFMKEGKLGEIGMVRAFAHSGGGPGERRPTPTTTDSIDMRCGPAPLQSFIRRFIPAVSPIPDYANGTLGDWGIHWMDHITWWTDELAPKGISSYGGRHISKDSTDSPDTQVVQFDYESFTGVWEHRRSAANNAEKHPLGICFYGTEGTMHRLEERRGHVLSACGQSGTD
jgi:predicted dehydrogenase